MRDTNVRTLEEIAPYLFMAAISPSYGTAINALLTDKPHSMDTPDWTLEMAIKYFAMKHASKPRDHSSNKQDSSSKPQDAHSKHDKQSDRQPDRQHEKQHDRQPGKSKCPDCGKSHLGACHTNITSNSLNPIPKPSNPSSNKQSTKATKLAADSIINKSYFAKVMAETSQYNWHIDSSASYIIISDKAWFVTYEPKENKHIKIGNKKLQKVKGIGTVKLPNGLRI
jgi:hypothetical protein